MTTNDNTIMSLVERRHRLAIEALTGAGFWYEIARYNSHLRHQCDSYIQTSYRAIEGFIAELEADRMGLFKQYNGYSVMLQTFKDYRIAIELIIERYSNLGSSPVPEWVRKKLNSIDPIIFRQLANQGFVAGVLPATGQFMVLAEPPQVDMPALAEISRAATEAHSLPLSPDGVARDDAELARVQALMKPPDNLKPMLTKMQIDEAWCDIQVDIPAECPACGELITLVQIKKIGVGKRYQIGCPLCNHGPSWWLKKAGYSLIQAAPPHSKADIAPEVDKIF